MKRVCIIQARLGSRRLPGKVLAPIQGRPLFEHQLRRLRECQAIDEIALATTTQASDDDLVQLAAANDVRVYRGSEMDVLGRFVAAARETAADVVVRVTGDCPLIDPGVVDQVVGALTQQPDRADYASNVLRRTYPRGLDAEAMFFDTLLRLNRLATSALEREHVTVAIRSTHAELFLTTSVEDATDNSDLRWTVDEAGDLDLIRTLYAELDLANTVVPYQQIIAFVRERPELHYLNAGVETWSPAMASHANSGEWT